jgi:hypothetical protein
LPQSFEDEVMTILRQAGQIGLVLLAFWATLSIDADNSQRFLVDAAHGAALSRELLGAIALIIAALSIGRFFLAERTSIRSDWWGSHRQWFVVAAIGGAAFGVLCLA